MDILSNLTNLLGGAAGQRGGGQDSGLGALGALAGMLGGGAPASGSGKAAADPLGGLGGLVGALLGGKGGVSSKSGATAPAAGADSLGGLGALIGSLMGGQGGNLLNQILGGEQAPPAPQANSGNKDQNRAVNTLRALVYAAKADGKLDAQEKQAISQEVQKLGLSAQAQQLVGEFLSEDVDPKKIARNITSSEEALQIYALSCAITRMDTFMERSYLDGLAQALGIPANAKQTIEQRIAQ